MDHDRAAHLDHGSISTTSRCSMNMFFNWQSNNLCIIFRWWHIQSTIGLLLSLLAIVFLTAGYEALRALSRRYEATVSKDQASLPNGDTERTPFLWTGRSQVKVIERANIVKAVLYASQSFYAFMLMLLFMTYNGWVMIAMFVGSFLGYLSFGASIPATKETACH